MTDISRRQFLKTSITATGGLLLACHLPGLINTAAAQTLNTTIELNPHIIIQTSGAITIMIPKSEMGQDIQTTLAMIICDELDADWAQVDVAQAPLNDKYGDQATYSSMSTISLWQPMRELAAQARAIFIQAAAAKWNINSKQCFCIKGYVYNSQARLLKVGYGELINDLDLSIKPKNVVLKDVKDFSLIGKSKPSLRIPKIVNAETKYGLDLDIPDMKYAAVARSPFFGGTLKHYNAEKTLSIPGVIKVI